MPITTDKLTSRDYVHLHTHTHYSLLDGLQKVPQLIGRVQELGMDAVALTDHGTMSGAIEFYKAATENSVKPIIGIETYVANRLHTDKDPTKDKSRFHLTLLAMNNSGYENMMRLSTIANLEGFYHKPRIDHELLEKYNEGIIVLSGCASGEIGEALRVDDFKKAEEIATWYKSVFGDRYYLELQDHGHEWDIQKNINDQLLKLAEKLRIKAVVTSDSHYLKKTDQEAHEILLCVQTGSFLSDEKRMKLDGMDLYLTDPLEVIDRWSDHPELISNTREIADRCDVEIKLGGILLPTFDLPDGYVDDYEYLCEMVYRGLTRRYADKSKDESLKLSLKEAKSLLGEDVITRAEFELGVIKKMGYASYFLIVQDFINWGKDKGIMFGPGRGSAAGSIVAYSLRITDLDPLVYDLLFERFLNPDRISMPDIDIDIQDSRRDEVIEYCVQKYGQDRVAHIVTFGKMAARNAIRDVARVTEVSYADADRLAKLVPPPVQGRHIPLEVSVIENSDLKHEYESNVESRKVIDQAIKLEGTIRSHGVHAAGVVIAPEEIVKYTPLEMAQKGVVATQYSMNPVEELGLLKMDFLGLSNLTIVKNTLRIIRKVESVDLDISTVPLTDKNTFALLSRGETTGVFQLESAGMKRYIKQLKPTEFEDIVAMGALYRPGPMQYIDDFIARKHGKKKAEYMHPNVKAALEKTYGIIVYQEQVMQIAKDLCGLTGGQADTLRKAIGKKIASLLAAQKEVFVQGGVNHSGVAVKDMEKLWQQLEDFAAYAFNKAHAACYGLISYWTAYLKANYPSAFMAALMTSDYDDTDRLAIEVNECRHMGIEVLQPDVNESFLEFAVVPDSKQIRFGMSAIKNLGRGAVEEIIRARDEGGRFLSVEDFVKRVNTRLVNRKSWESLIRAGAFDEFDERNHLLFNLDGILAYGSKIQKEAASGQTDLFGGVSEQVSNKLQFDQSVNEATEAEKLQWERELLGIYLSKHPLDSIDDFSRENGQPISDITTKDNNKPASVIGVVTDMRQITTKTGSKMAFVKLEDKSGETEIIVFPDSYSASEEFLVRDNIIHVAGKVSTKDRDGKVGQEIKIIADTITNITQETIDAYTPTGKDFDIGELESKTKSSRPRPSLSTKKSAQPKLYVHVKKPEDNDKLLELKQLLNKFPGNHEVVLVLGEKDKSALKLPFKVEANPQLTEQIGVIYSPDCVALK
jgi:DNA polymerase-3 subunit alpha